MIPKFGNGNGNGSAEKTKDGWTTSYIISF
jgi:hypothetical protein